MISSSKRSTKSARSYRFGDGGFPAIRITLRTILPLRRQSASFVLRPNIIRILLSFPPPFPDYEKEKHPELYDVLDIRTKELCNVAEEAGVRFTIEIEPHQLLNNLKSFFRVAEKVKSPNFKLNFDIGHVFLSEGGNLFKAIDDAKEFIVYSHVENMIMGEHAHKLPWDGDIDLVGGVSENEGDLL